jgi:hypothetical protein
MDISSAGYDLIVLWKVLSQTAKLYAVFFLASAGYASYSLIRVFAGLGNLREKAALTRVERRIANIRQIILLLLLLFGMTVANEAFAWLRAARFMQSHCGDCIDASGLLAAFAFAVFAVLVALHAFQWIASVRLQRHASDLSG